MKRRNPDASEASITSICGWCDQSRVNRCVLGQQAVFSNVHGMFSPSSTRGVSHEGLDVAALIVVAMPPPANRQTVFVDGRLAGIRNRGRRGPRR
jgi:hypothetical protein